MKRGLGASLHHLPHYALQLKVLLKKYYVLGLHRYRKSNLNIQEEARVQTLEGQRRVVHLCP